MDDGYLVGEKVFDIEESLEKDDPLNRWDERKGCKRAAAYLCYMETWQLKLLGDFYQSIDGQERPRERDGVGRVIEQRRRSSLYILRPQA